MGETLSVNQDPIDLYIFIGSNSMFTEYAECIHGEIFPEDLSNVETSLECCISHDAVLADQSRGQVRTIICFYSNISLCIGR